MTPLNLINATPEGGAKTYSLDIPSDLKRV